MKTIARIRHFCDDRIEEDYVDIVFYGDETYEDVKGQIRCHYCDTDPMVFIPTDGVALFPLHQHPNVPIINYIDIEAVE